MILGFHLLCRFCGNGDIEVSLRPAIVVTAARMLNDLNAVGNGGHIPKDRFQESDAVGVHRGHICGVHIVAACYLDREYRQHLYPISSLSVNGDGIIIIYRLQSFQLGIEVIVDLRHRSRDRHNARLPALVGKKDAEGGRHDSRHKDHRQEQHQHQRTAACRQDRADRRRHSFPDFFHCLDCHAAQLFGSPSAALRGFLKHLPLRLSLCRRPCATHDDCIVRRCVVSWSNTHGARGLGHGLSVLGGRTALGRHPRIAFLRSGHCASTVGRWRYNVPLCCSFLGKVPPIGGFRVLRSFLPPTLLRGGACVFGGIGMLRRKRLFSDFISCSGLCWRKVIFRRGIGRAAFRTNPHICHSVLPRRIFFALPQLSSVVLYHAPRGIRRPRCATAHIFLHAVGGVAHGIMALRLLFPLPFVHVLFQKGIGVFRRGVL